MCCSYGKEKQKCFQRNPKSPLEMLVVATVFDVTEVSCPSVYVIQTAHSESFTSDGVCLGSTIPLSLWCLLSASQTPCTVYESLSMITTESVLNPVGSLRSSSLLSAAQSPSITAPSLECQGASHTSTNIWEKSQSGR